MDTPFRNDVDALKTRLASLTEELWNLRAKARELDAVRDRIGALESEQEDLRREIDARTVRAPTPLLDGLKIASPCNASWDDMIGDDRTRFCGKCQKDVHNISEMTRDHAEAFLHGIAQSGAGTACIRMYKRTDGTVLTSDCPVGMRKKRVKRLFLATVGGGLAVAAGALAFWRHEETVVMGAIPVEPRLEVVGVAPMGTSVVMGGLVDEPTAPPAAEVKGTAHPPSSFATPPQKPPVPQKRTPPQTSR